MNGKYGLLKSKVVRLAGWRELLLDWVNEVVWEHGPGPDYSIHGVHFSLGGICSPKTTG